jgi:hypothetical protein
MEGGTLKVLTKEVGAGLPDGKLLSWAALLQAEWHVRLLGAYCQFKIGVPLGITVLKSINAEVLNLLFAAKLIDPVMYLAGKTARTLKVGLCCIIQAVAALAYRPISRPSGGKEVWLIEGVEGVGSGVCTYSLPNPKCRE